jgi:hypothetical protein
MVLNKGLEDMVLVVWKEKTVIHKGIGHSRRKRGKE